MTQGTDPLDRNEVAAHASFVRGLARGIVADAAAADDVAQETLLKLLKGAAAPTRRSASFRAWLARSIRNLAIQWRLADVRRAAREAGSTAARAAPATDALVQRMELHRQVVEATLALDEGQRAVVALHYFEGLPMAEVAQRLGLPLETARTRLKRALEKLRERVEPAGCLLFLVKRAATTLRTPLAITTAGKLAIAAAPLVAVGAWWLAQGTPLAAERAPVVADHGSTIRASEEASSLPKPAADATRSAEAAADAAPYAIDGSHVTEGFGTVNVRVLSSVAHESIAGIGVRIVPAAQPHAIAAAVRGTTDSEGVFVASKVRAGACVAALAGFPVLGAAPFTVEPDGTCDVVLVAPDECAIDGRVVDGDERPVAGASIWLCDLEDTSILGPGGAPSGFSRILLSDGQIVAASDEEGRFELLHVPSSGAVAAFAPGFATSPRHQLIAPGAARRQLTIRLDRAGAAVAGRVIDGAGLPIADAVVSVDPIDAPQRDFHDGILRLESAPRRERTDLDGRFLLEGAPLAPVRLVVAAGGFAPSVETITPVAPTGSELVVVLGGGGRLAGSVHDESGRPLAGVAVEIAPADYPLVADLDAVRACSDERGEFLVDHLPAVPLRATIADPQQGRAALDFTVAVGETRRFDAVLSRGRILRGRLVDEHGKPLQRFKVSAVGDARDGARSIGRLAQPESDGRFEFSGCDDTDYKLSVRDPMNPTFAFGKPVTTRPDRGEALLKLRDSELPSSSIFGSLRVPDGFSPADALFDVRRLDGEGVACTMAGRTTDRFWSGPYPAGRYALALRISRLPWRDLGVHELEPGRELDLGEIVFERPARVVIRAHHADGSSVDPKELVVVGRDAPYLIPVTRSGDELVAGPLDPGRYLLRGAGSAAGSLWRPFECSSGESVELAATFEPGALRVLRFEESGRARAPDRLSIRCLDANGAELWSQTLPADTSGGLELRARFPLGRFTLEAAADDRSRATVDFEVATLADAATPHEVALRR